MNIAAASVAPAWRALAHRLAAAVPIGLRRAFVPFLASRVAIVLVLTLVPLLAQVPLERWHRDEDISIKLPGRAIVEGIGRLAIGNDSAWYYTIAHDGYEHRAFDISRQANWAFFPLHPLLWRAAAGLTGEWIWSGVALANLLCLAGLALLWTLARRLTDSERMADQTTSFASFWPTGYFMMLPYTESLFFALVTASFLAVLARRGWIAGLLGCLAGATRLNGVFLAPAFFMHWLEGERRLSGLAKLLPIAGGLAAFMAYLWAITGNPLAFEQIQVAWGRELHAPWTALLDYVHHPGRVAAPWNPKLLNFGATVVALCSAVTCWKRGWRGLAVFTLLTLAVPLLTGTLTSMTRYVGVAPGVPLALASWSEKRPRFGQVWMALSAMSLTLLCTLFALGISVGGA